MKITLIANNNGSLLKLCFTSEKVIGIGRDIGNTIAPLSVDGVSRNHAKIFEKDGKWFLEDLGSMNGTYRLGQKVEGTVELAVRDMLQFGKFIMSVDEIEGDVAAAHDAAPVAAVPPVAETIKPADAPAAAPASESVSAAASAPAVGSAPVSAAAPTTALRRPQLPSMKSGLKLPP
jgi:predicted component of type VI protein secretion system